MKNTLKDIVNEAKKTPKISLLFYLFFLAFGVYSASYNANKEKTEIISTYNHNYKNTMLKLPADEQYLTPLLISTDYKTLHTIEQMSTTNNQMKNQINLFIKENGNNIIIALLKLLKKILDRYNNNQENAISDLEEKTFIFIVPTLQKTNFFIEENLILLSNIQIEQIKIFFIERLNSIKTKLPLNKNISLYLKKIEELHIFLKKGLNQRYEPSEPIEKKLKEVIKANQNKENPNSIKSLINQGVNTIGSLQTTLAENKSKIEALQKTILLEITKNAHTAMKEYSLEIKRIQETLENNEKYLAYLFRQFAFNKLYLYDGHNQNYLKSITQYFLRPQIKARVNKYSIAILTKKIGSLEKLIENAYKYFITNNIDRETGLLEFTLSEKERKAYAFLYEFAKDVIAYQMAIKEVDQNLQSLERLSNLIEEYLGNPMIKEKNILEVRQFLEPLYQMAYFFNVIQLKNFNSQSIIKTIKTILNDVQEPSDPDLNKTYIDFIINLSRNHLPAPILWFIKYGISLIQITTEHSLVFVLKTIYPDTIVDTKKSSNEQLKEAFVQIGKQEITKKIPLGNYKPVKQFTETGLKKILDSVEKNITATLNPKPIEQSGLIEKNIPQPSPQSNRLQNEKNNHSLFDQIKDYFFSLFSWIWQ